MSDLCDAIDSVREEARRAAEDAKRLRAEAKNLERRLREEASGSRRHGRRDRRSSRKARGRRSDGYADADSGPAAEETFTTTGIKTVRVNQTAGNVTVVLCNEGESPGVRTSGQRSAPNLDVTRSGDSLSIDIHLSIGWLFRRRQGARTVVRLGAEQFDKLEVEIGHGSVRVEAAAAIVIKLHAGAGDISATDCSGDLDGEVGAGRVSVTNHSGLVVCHTGTGETVVDVAEAKEGRYSLQAGMGRLELRLPSGLSTHIEVSSGIGRKSVHYPDAGPGAPIQLLLNTGIGEAVIRERAAAGGRSSKAAAQPAARPAPEPSPRREADELRILQMLEQGRLSFQEAAELIAALHGAPPPNIDEIAGDDQFLGDDDFDEQHPTDALEDVGDG